MTKLQQGDVIIRPVTGIPQGSRRINRTPRGYILARGEVTGHAHIIQEEDIEMYEKDGVLYIRVDRLATVVHEEHGPVALRKGMYSVNLVRQHDPVSGEIRRDGD